MKGNTLETIEQLTSRAMNTAIDAVLQFGADKLTKDECNEILKDVLDYIEDINKDG